MNIFGWTITRTSKKEEEERDLEIFEKCVDTMDKVIMIGRRNVQMEPNIHTIQSVGEVQEHLESLIDIYTKNKFSRPTKTFELASLIHEMRTIYVSYVKAASQRALAVDELNKLRSPEDVYGMYGESFKAAMAENAKSITLHLSSLPKLNPSDESSLYSFISSESESFPIIAFPLPILGDNHL